MIWRKRHLAMPLLLILAILLLVTIEAECSFFCKEYQLALADAKLTIAMASKMKPEPVSIARTAPQEFVVRSRELQAMCHLALKDYQQALPECDYVLRQTDVNDRQFSSPRIRHYLMRGIAHGGLAHQQETLAHQQEARTHYQKALEDFAHVTDVCLHQEKYHRIFEGENCGVVPYYRGDVYLGLKKYREAISDYDSVLENLESWKESHKDFLLTHPYIGLPDLDSVRRKRTEAQPQLP